MVTVRIKSNCNALLDVNREGDTLYFHFDYFTIEMSAVDAGIMMDKICDADEVYLTKNKGIPR